MRNTPISVLSSLALMTLIGGTIGCGNDEGGEGAGVGVSAGTELTIMYSNNNDGEIEPCG